MNPPAEILQGDCTDVSESIESGSVDLILTDPPYGTLKGADLDGWDESTTAWDDPIPPGKIHDISNRLLRKNGKLLLFSQEPYTSELITKAKPNLPFSYRMIWKKDHFPNALVADKAPVNKYEDIVVFTKNHDLDENHPLRSYFADVLDFVGLNRSQINSELGHRRAEHCFYISSTQFSLCTKETYGELVDVFGIDELDGFRRYEELNAIDQEFKRAFENTFNLWEGGGHKSNVFEYSKVYDAHHPTQKPVDLLEDLIKTFSNERDVVVDLTAGSGSTAVACQNTNRESICIEKDPEYYQIATERIEGNVESATDDGPTTLESFGDGD